MEKAILSEIEKAVDLIGQENIQNAKIIEDKIIFICNPDFIILFFELCILNKTENAFVKREKIHLCRGEE